MPVGIIGLAVGAAGLANNIYQETQGGGAGGSSSRPVPTDAEIRFNQMQVLAAENATEQATNATVRADNAAYSFGQYFKIALIVAGIWFGVRVARKNGVKL